MRVRRANANDAPGIAAAERECFPWDYPTPVDISDGLWWVAVSSDGEIAGFLFATPWEHRDESALVILLVGVRPAFRGRGLQRRLVRAAIGHARRAGTAEVWTYTLHDNVPSANNFAALGFRLWIPAVWDGDPHPTRPRGGQAVIFWRIKA